jgi:hypothetical protein
MLGEKCFVGLCIIPINIISLGTNYISFFVTSFILLFISVIVSAHLLAFLAVCSTSYESDLKLAKKLVKLFGSVGFQNHKSQISMSLNTLILITVAVVYIRRCSVCM